MCTVIILLGSPNDRQGNLSSISIERCNQAINEYRNNENCKILPTGGYGSHFNTTNKPHAFYTSQYLISKNIPKEDILDIAESTNTIEDAKLSKIILEKYKIEKLIIVTSDFHHDRVNYIFQNEFPNLDFTISCSKTNLPLEELQKIKQHEKNALENLIKNNETYAYKINGIF